MAEQSSEDAIGVTRSARDYGALLERMNAWIRTREPDGSPEVANLVVPERNGMSSDTVLFDLVTDDGAAPGRRRNIACVARIAPEPDAVPVFADYDFAKQYEIIRLVGERTNVPVPPLRWLELDASHIGSPFFVMERVPGTVPPDVMPYTFGSWLTDTSVENQRHLQDASVEVLAGIHSLQLDDTERAFLEFDQPGETALRRHVQDQRRFYEWVAQEYRHPLLEAAFDWLEAHWPEHDTDAYVSWGDARIGNVLYENFEPVGVLDWEMAAIAPREVDIGWMIYLHRFFQDMTEQMDMPGMPEFMRLEDVAATYERTTGYAPCDLDFYIVYAALRHGIVMSRVTQRSIHFGDATMPDDPDDLIMHRATIEAMLAGDYLGRLRTGD